MRYFLDLNFYPDELHLGSWLQYQRNLWTLLVYLLFSIGIFSSQIISFPPIIISFANCNLTEWIASFILGLLILAPVIRFLNKKGKKPGIETVLSPLTIGFFLPQILKVPLTHLVPYLH